MIYRIVYEYCLGKDARREDITMIPAGSEEEAKTTFSNSIWLFKAMRPKSKLSGFRIKEITEFAEGTPGIEPGTIMEFNPKSGTISIK